MLLFSKCPKLIENMYFDKEFFMFMPIQRKKCDLEI